MAELSVVIVNYNGESLLTDCLNSLSEQTYRDFEVIFVDNGSEDDSVMTAKANYHGIQCIELGENTGFAHANNVGIRAANGKYIVLLNNDTKVALEFLEKLVAVAESRDHVGMVAPKILNFYETKKIDSVGGLIICADGIAQGRGRGEHDQGQYDGVEEVLLPSGCACMYSREMLDDIGFFDDLFFMYCEDTDLGLRGRWAGWKAYSAPDSVVYHKYSGSSSSYSPFKLFLVERNHYFAAVKNFTVYQLVQLPIWTIYRFGLMGFAVLSGKGKGQAGQTGSLVVALLKAQVAAGLGTFGALKRRARPKRIRQREFTKLLQRHRLSMWKMILKE